MATPPRTPRTPSARTDSTGPSPASSLEVQLEALVVSRCGVDTVLPRSRVTHRADWFPADGRTPRARRDARRDAL